MLKFQTVKPFKKLSSSMSTPGVRTEPQRLIVRTPTPTESTDVENASRAAAGVGPGETGFTCVRCLQWFPKGTSHACQSYADVIRNPLTERPATHGMTAEEQRLLAEAGQ